MKKNNGFTLIELLAVIVILAMIALIATPIVLNIIDKTRGNVRTQTANGVLNATKYFYTESLLDATIIYPAEGLTFVCDGKVCQATVGTVIEEEGIAMLAEEEPTIYKLVFNGTVPTSGSVVIKGDGTIIPTNLAIDSHICTYDENKKVFTEC